MTLQQWRSIDESLSDPAAAGPIVLRGLPVVVPASYDRVFGRKGAGALVVTVASFLWRATAWSFSILAHLLFLLLLLHLMIREPDSREIIVEMSLARGNAGEEGKSLEKLPPEKVEEPEPEPETKPEPEPEPDPEPVPVPPKVVKESDPLPEKEATPPSPKSDVIGKGSGSEKLPPPEPAEVDPSLVERDPTEATKTRRAGDLASLRRGSAREIVVVSGAYDKVEKVLSRLGIPHTRVSHTQIAGYDLSKCVVLLVNCHTSQSRKSSGGGKVSSMKREVQKLDRQVRTLEKSLASANKRKDLGKTRELERQIRNVRTQKRYYERILERLEGAKTLVGKLRDFVKEGGYLFTSDWGITLLEKAFPGYVRIGGTFGPKTVGIRPRKGKENDPLLEDVFLLKSTLGLRWEIDSGTYLIRTGSSRVTTLVESGSLPRYRAVAVVFSPTRDAGRVLHVVSHFSKQADGYGEFALQNLVLNFILERMARRP